MNELIFIGLGLYDEKDISVRGLEELKEADTVFAEFYTSLMPGLSIRKLEEMIGKEVKVVSRRVLEEEEGQIFMEEEEEEEEEGQTFMCATSMSPSRRP